MKLILFIVFIVIVVFGIGVYLSPNDLKRCGTVPSDKSNCQTADAIIAVSGGDTAARTKEAIGLYNGGWAPKLIFSGAALDQSGPSNAAVMRNIAIDAGVPEEDILIEEESRTTQQNAENTKALIEEASISSIILVTSPYHQRRASLEFESLYDGIEMRNHPVTDDRQWLRWWWTTPGGWYLALGELAKIVVFYAGGQR